jgi:hypothetical protein
MTQARWAAAQNGQRLEVRDSRLLELRAKNFEFQIAASQAHRVVLLACVVLFDLAIYNRL